MFLHKANLSRRLELQILVVMEKHMERRNEKVYDFEQYHYTPED